MKTNTKIRLLRIAFGIGVVLDAVAFIQMAFPEIGRRMMRVAVPRTPDYLFAINLAAGLMLAWTLLLVWAIIKPLERRMILPLTMIIITWNVCTMAYGLNVGLFPAAALLPQMVVVGLLFLYCGFCFLITARAEAVPNCD